MGQSTDANLAYGIDLGEEWIIPQVYQGLDADDDDYWSADIDEYIESLVEADNPEVELQPHCSGEYFMYILCVPGTRIRASRGYPESIEVESLNDLIVPLAVKRFNDWCEKHLPEPFRDADPSWLLYSMWW